MPKRRERDRPKNAPGSLYNPNKRVLLSYASDDEEQEEEEVAHKQQASRPSLPVYDEPVPTTPKEDDEPEVLNSNAASNQAVDAVRKGQPSKKDQDDASEDEDEQTVGGKSSFRGARPGIHANAVTGQRAALGSWSYQWEDDYDEEEDEDFDSAEADAMAYLKAVRSERQHLPEVLVASRHTTDGNIYELGSEDTHGYISDGAYVARGSMGPKLPDHLKTTTDPRDAFTSSLKQRFLAHRQLLHTPPTPGAVEALSDQHPISFPHSNNRAYADWQRFILKGPPQTAQLQAMEQDTLSNILDLIRSHFLVREKFIAATTSAWVWAVLARLDGVETMSNDQVWAIREFAKKAVLVHLSFDDADSAAALERLAIQGPETGMTILPQKPVEDVETVDGTFDSVKLHEESERKLENTFAIVDSIIVIVGDVFGQRDLLEFRRAWTEDDAES